MAYWKPMLVLFLSALVVCSMLNMAIEARDIGYGSIEKGNGIPCDPNNQQNCKPKAKANPYERGCETIDQCRHN
ncbi:hypothetical protein L6164_002833 [Bauhinia variegata]|uniref:Uncharacterized protein n=3 Tax=Bauhinia variegata TaxID=167791 RepID=A0ACB9Q005_BAUVA|nr:hypothetical protein L6164_002811 [Bauhinia variegata]KAI4353910.1 hypothetical protein L6164_002830 [Bauhinia variegata]KAI4353913.1 hypothetical protein L6164_002833 [Bauhinia variegata]